MTVAEIKEYIDERTTEIYETEFRNKEYINDSRIAIKYGETIKKVYSMLDELEPKAKWTNNMNGTFTCSRCGAKRPNDNYCGNCGARMEIES